jgi:transposase-like protein
VGSRSRPTFAVGDGALGFWKAIEEVFPGARHQRCWVHKTANVLNKVALSVQINMKADLREIYGAPTRAAAEAAIDVFANKYGAKYDKAVACLTKDREALLAFFDFPAEHWDHLRTSNPIESVFATVRHRTVRTKGALSAKTAKLMVFKLVNAAAKTWRRLNGSFYFKKTHVIDPTKRISAGRAVLLATAWSDRRRAGRRLEPGSGSGWQPR